MITAICQECNKQFEYELKPGFPRKYCPECSAIKKASFAAKEAMPVEKNQALNELGYVPTPKMAEVAPIQAKETIVRTITDKPHSYEFGKAGARHKVYYGMIEDLKAHIEILKNAGLVQVEEVVDFKNLE